MRHALSLTIVRLHRFFAVLVPSLVPALALVLVPLLASMPASVSASEPASGPASGPASEPALEPASDPASGPASVPAPEPVPEPASVPASGPAWAQEPAELPQSQSVTNAEKIKELDALISHAIETSNTPGAVIAIARHDGLVFLKAYGNRQLKPTVEPMPADAIFDLASVTKVSATTLAVALLMDRGKLDITKPVAFYLPEFGAHGKDHITVQQCLLHTAGLTLNCNLADSDGSPEGIWQSVCEMKLQNVGTFSYSSVGMIVLGKVVERISGQSLDVFVKENITQPLGMEDTGFLPPVQKRGRCVPTAKRHPQDAEWERGEVNDFCAFAMQGVAGHAGNFSTASDLARLGVMLLNRGVYTQPNGKPASFLSPEVFDTMVADYPCGGNAGFWNAPNVRGLGWDKRSCMSRSRSRNLSNSAIGHSGWTGTAFWVDLEKDICVVFLSSRLHPNGQGDKDENYTLAAKVGTLALEILGIPCTQTP